MCIDRYSCLLNLTRLWAITKKQPNIFAVRVTLGTATACQMLSDANFDIHVRLVQCTSRALFVDFGCSDLKHSRIVCLHIQNIVMIIFQT